MADITIIIPHRGNGLGLWSTIHSCEEDLRDSGIDYNFVVVTNGETVAADVTQSLLHLTNSGRLCKHIHSESPLTPPVARQRGASEADGKLLFFFDNHCLVARDYFKRSLLAMADPKIDMLHSTTCYYTNQGHQFHYCLNLGYNFWAGSTAMVAPDYKAYPIAVGGHGGFLIRKAVWEEVGGYGPEELFVGYGGEEVLFDLKMWLYGKTNYLDPRVVHYHYTGPRGYDRHHTDDYYRNMMVTAHIIGGEKWLNKVYDSFSNKVHIRINPKKNMYDLMMDAYYCSAQYAKEVAGKRTRTLDELLIWFRQNQVEM